MPYPNPDKYKVLITLTAFSDDYDKPVNRPAISVP